MVRHPSRESGAQASASTTSPARWATQRFFERHGPHHSFRTFLSLGVDCDGSAILTGFVQASRSRKRSATSERQAPSVTLVALDGTWQQAKVLAADTQNLLHEIPENITPVLRNGATRRTWPRATSGDAT